MNVFKFAEFPISRDPPEGGTSGGSSQATAQSGRFQFLGIPPKGERYSGMGWLLKESGCFQFLGIPPKGELPRLRE